MTDDFNSVQRRQKKKPETIVNKNEPEQNSQDLNDNNVNQKNVIEPEKNDDEIDKKIDIDNKKAHKNSTVSNNNDLNIIDLKENWQSFIDKVHIKKPSIASILDKSIPFDIVDGSITIKISSALDFHLNMIENNTDIINQILSTDFGEGIRFTIEKNNETTTTDSDEKKNRQMVNTEKSEQIRDKIVDLFDGEILT
jgi:hypothetical protein